MPQQEVRRSVSPRLGMGEVVQQGFEDLGDVPPQQPLSTLGGIVPSLCFPHDLIVPLIGLAAPDATAKDGHDI